MGAMVSRLKENSDFFVGIDITFKSGTREFVMEITREDEAYSCFFLGVKTEITIEDISDIITDKLIDYESAVIVYRDRMSELIISCDDKNVSSKQRDAKNDVPKTATVGGREYIIKTMVDNISEQKRYSGLKRRLEELKKGGHSII